MSQPRKSGSASPQINPNMAQFYPSTNVNNTVPTNAAYSPTTTYSHMPHYGQMEPPRTVTVYPLPSAQWQYPPPPHHSFQREMGTTPYPVSGGYPSVEQIPQAAAHYPPTAWTDTASPVEEHPSPTLQRPDYFYRRQTSPRGARTESGPSRTSRTSRRTPSLQDATGMMSPTDGASGEVAEAAAGSLSKRPKQANSGTTNDAKGFACDLCSATFTRKGDCLRHRRSVHTRETPYDCQGCGDQFSRSDMRGKHWKAEPECETVHWREVCKAMGHANLVEQ